METSYASDAITNRGGSVLIRTRAVPRASKTQLIAGAGGELKLRIAAAPVDDAANVEAIKYLSKLLKVSKSSIEIIAGQKSRIKSFLVSGKSITEVKATIERTLL